MRLWYQSGTREDAWGPYYAVLRAILDDIRDPDTRIDIHGITRVGGLGKQMTYLDHLETHEVIDNALKAQAEGYDAFLIGHFSDTGLEEIRKFVHIPVLALCESAIHQAAMMGANFAVVAINEKGAQRNVEKIARYGLRSRLHSVPRMTMDRTLDLNLAFTDVKERRRVCDQFLGAANQAVDAGAEVVISAGGVVMALLVAAGVHQAARGAPILNGILALVKNAEAAVKMNRVMGGRFRKRYDVKA